MLYGIWWVSKETTVLSRRYKQTPNGVVVAPTAIVTSWPLQFAIPQL
jgi:hypothetical protein